MDNNYLLLIGKRISEIRRSHNMTQEALADKLSVSPKHISHIERRTSGLSLKNLIQICELFNCSLDYIVFGQSDDIILSKLPPEIRLILHTGNEQDIDRLKRYLQIYIELQNGQA